MIAIEEEIFKSFTYDGMEYKIGNFGTIYGTRFSRPLKQRLNEDGYLEVTMGKAKGKRTTFRVHRLVAMLFVPNPNNYTEVNHKDYNRANPRYDNLEWINHADNVKYSSNIGRYKECKIGVNNGKARYSKAEVIKIRELYDSGENIMNIIKIIFPDLSYKERKNMWNGIKNIATRKSYTNI